MQYVINIVEDEVNLNNILTAYLEKEGYRVNSFINGQDAKNAIGYDVDMWVVDIMLPDINGYSLFKQINEKTPNAMIIFMSARNKELDRVVGLEMGCDDYISKPFLPQELIIRVRKLLQNRSRRSEEKNINVAGYRICVEQRKVFQENIEIELSTKEYEMMMFFLRNQDNAVSRDQILEQVWREDYFGSYRVVDDTIRRIRKKMPAMDIETIYGYGYRFRREASKK